MADRVGQHLGRYRLIRLLGRGGFAEVYLGEHQRLGTQAAIKVLHTSLEDDDVEGFLHEAQVVAHLRHPHIVRVLDFDVEDHTPFLVMDYLPNGNMRRSYPKGIPLPLQTIVTYATQVASALQYAHDEKLIHRDIKPENMLLDRDQTLVLSDFGIALMSQSSRYQSTQEVAGTAAYMAPEQFQGHPRRASDQYALAVVVYEWLTGDHPFHGSFSEIASQHLFVPPSSLHKRVPTIPLEVEQVVLTALAKDPGARFASVQAFATALQAAANLSLLDRRSARTGGASDAGNASPVTGSPEDGISPLNPTKGQDVPAMPPPAFVGSLEASARVPLSEKQAPPTASSAETTTTSPASPGTKWPSEIVELPLDQRTVLPSPLPVAQRKKLLPSISITPSSLSTRMRLPAGRTIVLVLLVLVVVGGGGIWATLYVTTHRPPATPIATAQVTPALSPYDQFVTKNGIQFGFDAERSHFNPYESQLSPATVATLAQAWMGTVGNRMQTSPTVANGVVYVGSDDGTLYVFNADGCGQSACSPLWTATTGGNIQGTAAVANGVVYIGSYDGKLYAFQANGCGQLTCLPLWTAATGSLIGSSPAVASGVVYISSFWDHKLYAFQANGCGQPTCSPLWTATTGDRIFSSPAVANGVVYIGSYDDKLYAFQANGCGHPTCLPLWTASTDGEIYSSPAVANGVVYINSHDQLYVFHRK